MTRDRCAIVTKDCALMASARQDDMVYLWSSSCWYVRQAAVHFLYYFQAVSVALTTSFTTENGDEQNSKCKWAEAILASERRIHTIAYDTIEVFETSSGLHRVARLLGHRLR